MFCLLITWKSNAHTHVGNNNFVGTFPEEMEDIETLTFVDLSKQQYLMM